MIFQWVALLKSKDGSVGIERTLTAIREDSSFLMELFTISSKIMRLGMASIDRLSCQFICRRCF